MQHAQGDLLSGRYELHGLVGKGATTWTYAARDRQTGRSVSVRHWSAGASDDTRAAAELERQVALAKAVGHVHLQTALELDPDHRAAAYALR
jgi:hypothetical protein